MKISKKPKGFASTHPAVGALITSLTNVPEDEIPTLLNSISTWIYPRSDLHFWVDPLNRFDAILETICNDYDLKTDSFQQNDFTPRTKDLILAILRFSKLLLENATNRKLYSSFDRLNNMLITSDTDVLEAILRLMLRRAQQTSGHSLEPLHISTDRLLDLSQTWTAPRDSGLEMASLVKSDPVEIPTEATEISFRFYRRANMSARPVASSSIASSAPKPASTPAHVRSGKEKALPSQSATPTDTALTSTDPPANQTEEGMVNINLGRVHDVEGKSCEDILADAVDAHKVPTDSQFGLLQKIRIARALPSLEQRQQLLILRMLAISVLVFTARFATVEAKLYLYEPELIPQLAEIVQPDSDVPMRIQAAALMALDGISRNKPKLVEVTTAVNASVSHGILMDILRKITLDSESENPKCTAEYIDAYFGLITFFQSSGLAGNMLLGAGCIPLLVQVVKNQRPEALSVVNRAVTYLDTFTYSFMHALPSFVQADGPMTFVHQVKHIVQGAAQYFNQDASIDKSAHVEGLPELPHAESVLLKSLFRSLQRLMQSGGTSEGLRGLIDSSLPSSCKEVMLHRRAFGPQNFALAINIMLTFVHSEPTSLAIIQENKLPDIFYDTIEHEIDPSFDVINAIPHAIGALCLNEAGLNHFIARDTLKKFFAIFTSEPHARILQERENAVGIGSTVDELMRHHPTLKTAVLEQIMATLKHIEEAGQDYKPPRTNLYTVLPTQQGAETTTDVPMTPIASKSDNPPESTSKKEEIKDNHILLYITVMGRFLEGVFATAGHCREFVKLGGIDHLLRLHTLPCMPFDQSAMASTYSGLSTLLMVINELAATQLLQALTKALRTVLEECQPFSQSTDVQATCESILDPPASEYEQSSKLFRCLTNAQTITHLLGEMYALDGYANGRATQSALMILKTSEESQTLLDLGNLHRACVLAAVQLKKAGTVPASSEVQASSSVNSVQDAVDGAVESITMEIDPSNQTSTGLAITTTGLTSTDANETRTANRKALRQVISAIPDACRVLYQGLGGLSAGKRNQEATVKRDAMAVAKTIAQVLNGHLELPSTDNVPVKLDYATVMIRFFQDLLARDRNTGGNLHVMILSFLVQEGGLVKLDQICRLYIEHAADISNVEGVKKDADARIRLVHALGGLKLTLTLFETLTATTTVNSPSQLQSIERDKKAAAYINYYALIVNLRYSILCTVRDLWSASFLSHAPPMIIRGVIRVLNNILKADQETEATDQSPAAIIARASSATTNPRIANENIVQQLVDMGFPRTAAQMALIRRGNNLNAAAEYLLSRPDQVTAARASEEALVRAAHLAAVPPHLRAAQEAVMDAAPVSDMSPEDIEASAVIDPLSTKYKLDADREALRDGFIEKALELAAEFSEIVFDLKESIESIEGSYGKGLAAVINSVSNAIAEPQTPKLSDKALASRIRLIALILNDSNVAAIIADDPLLHCAESLGKVLETAAKLYLGKKYTATDRPSWIASLMLVADAYLTYIALPTVADIDKLLEKDSAVPVLQIRGPTFEEGKDLFFQVAMDILREGIADREIFISTTRLLVVLTRTQEYCQKFVQSQGIRLMLDVFQKHKTETESSRPYAAIIFRHIVEDTNTIQACMRSPIESWFNKVRRNVDVATYLRELSFVALRDPASFITVTAKYAQVTESSSKGYIISKKPTPPVSTAKNGKSSLAAPVTVDGDAAMAIDTQSSEVKPVESTTQDKEKEKEKDQLNLEASPLMEEVVHALVAEIITASKTSLATQPLPKTTQPADQSPTQKDDAPLAHTSVDKLNERTDIPDTKDKEKNKDKDSISSPLLDSLSYTCFVTTCLRELVESYLPAKTSFFKYGRKRADGSQSALLGKTRQPLLAFMLSDLLSHGQISAVETPEHTKRIVLSRQVVDFVVALASQPSHMAGKSTAKDPSAELTSVRKSVLDAVAKSFKDVSASSDTVEGRYSQLFALSTLCDRLLGHSSENMPPSVVQRILGDRPMAIAKLMLERNFAPILTNALADIDLNFPSVQHLINAILSPLEALTRIVTKVSKTPDNAVIQEEHPSETEDDDSQMSDMDEDVQDETAPDVYRNSALGMYEGELEGANTEDAYGATSEMEDDEEMYDEDAEMEELDNGVVPSDISDEDTEDEEEMAAAFEEDMRQREEEDLGESTDGSEHDSAPSDDEGTDMDDQEAQADGANAVFDLQDDNGVLEIEVPADVLGENGPWDNMPAGTFALDEDPDAEGDLGEGNTFDEEMEMDDDQNENQGFDLLPGAEAMFGGGPNDPMEMLGENGEGYIEIDMDMGMDHTDDIMNVNIRSTRPVPGQSRANANNLHPLLVDEARSTRETNVPMSRNRMRMRSHQESQALQMMQEFGQMMAGGGPGGILNALFGGGGLPFGEDGNGGEGPIAHTPATPTQPWRTVNRSGGVHRSSRQHRAAPTEQDHIGRLLHIPALQCTGTTHRWQEDVQISSGGVSFPNRAQLIVNPLINTLLPDMKQRMAAREEQSRKAKESLAKAQEEEAKQSEESKEQESSDQDVAMASPEEETPASIPQQAPPADAPPTEAPTQPALPQDSLAEVLDLARMLAAPAQSALPAEEATPMPAQEATPMPAQEPAQAEASSSAAANDAPPRVFIQIRGQQVDITNTGIDPEFLEALPDEMREEVISQHLRENRPSGSQVPQAASSINSEFLDALPPEIRAEVLAQEAIEQARRNQEEIREQRRANGEAVPDEETAPMEIDPATFLATLDPTLRQTVLMDNGDAMMDNLPPDLMAELSALRARLPRRQARRGVPALGFLGNAPQPPKKASQPREGVQLLDKAGVATLVRLLFYPPPLKKNALRNIIIHLCENSKTRVELVNLLLMILHDGIKDISAVDKSFSQMSLRASKGMTPKATPKRKTTGDSTSLNTSSGDSVPNLVAQRCLEALAYLVNANDQTALFFLTEQESSLILGKKSLKKEKGKGKEKAVTQPSTTYPIVILLSLLDRPSIFKTPAIMEALTRLISSITAPLRSFDANGDPVGTGRNTDWPTAEPNTTDADRRDALRRLAFDALGPLAGDMDGGFAPPAEESLGQVALAASTSNANARPATAASLKLTKLPQIPGPYLRLVVNILDSGDCSSKMFSDTLTVIQNLSCIPEARDIIEVELSARAKQYGQSLLPDLTEFATALEEARGPSDVKSQTLHKFSPASSQQAKLLRLLLTIEHATSKAKKPEVKSENVDAGESKDKDQASGEAKSEVPVVAEGTTPAPSPYDTPEFSQLWASLSKCLDHIENKLELMPYATVLLPLVEAYCVCMKNILGPTLDAKKKGTVFEV